MSPPKQLVIFPTGSLSAKDRERLTRSGFVAIEATDPSKVIVAIPGQSFGDTDLLKIALKTLCSSDYGAESLRAKFTEQLTAHLIRTP